MINYDKKLRAIIFLVLAGTQLTFTSCSDDPEDPVIENEEEVITTLTYTLTPTDGGDPIIFSFKDLDGDGPNEAVYVEGSAATLSSQTNYSGVLDLLNEAKSTAESITEEVEEEAEDHQFFFVTTMSDLQIVYADTDSNGNPLGLLTSVTTGEAGSGIIQVILRHKPDKTASGVASGDITSAGGETDIDIEFAVTVE